MQHHFNYYLPAEQLELLREVSSHANASVAEVLRRLTQAALTTPVLDQTFPCCSGLVTASGRIDY